jgi:hypothetical protein
MAAIGKLSSALSCMCAQMQDLVGMMALALIVLLLWALAAYHLILSKKLKHDEKTKRLVSIIFAAIIALLIIIFLVLPYAAKAYMHALYGGSETLECNIANCG